MLRNYLQSQNNDARSNENSIPINIGQDEHIITELTNLI